MKRAIQHQTWLALLHQLPTRPPYLRVRIWRRLQAVGAVPLKNAVHILPRNAQAEAAFRELLNDIKASGGEAVLAELRLVDGQTDADLRAAFDAARDADYADLVRDAGRLVEGGSASVSEIGKLHRRLADIAALDFFGAHGRQGADAVLRDLDAAQTSHADIYRRSHPAILDPGDLKGRTWVTRAGVHVDRIASAWLIRRFIDPEAKFRFATGGGYEPAPGELRFDMADAEFTHEEDRCSFETLLLRVGPQNDPALIAIAEMVHELDIADGKFERPETAGFGAMLSGVCASMDDDAERIEAAGAMLDQFYRHFTPRHQQAGS